MKAKPTLPDNGVRIDNLLTMALRHRRRERESYLLVLLALMGGVSFVLTFLSMFSPICDLPVLLLVTVTSLLFFCWHGHHGRSRQFSLYLVLTGYMVLITVERHRVVSGMVHLMNAICQTIYQTDWLYFEPFPQYDAEGCTTFLLCVLVFPIMALLGYAVMRYKNFFLSWLVTFPFVELGFFFGVTPEHMPAICLFAFWCGMGAVQLASSGIMQKNGQAGFQRRRNTFFPVAGMRFLLAERAGMTTAAAVLLIAFMAEHLLTATGYERPAKIKDLRTEFQYYAAGIDWSDWTTLLPSYLRGKNQNNTEVEIELGRDDAREFENKPVSGVFFSEMPQSRIYLRYRAAHLYENSLWSSLPEEAYTDDIIGAFEELKYYPPEFLYYAAPAEGKMTMTLHDATDLLAQCVPYGYRENLVYRYDDIQQTWAEQYEIYGGMDYENLILQTSFAPFRTADLLAQCKLSNPEEWPCLDALAAGHEEETVYMSLDGARYRKGVEAALLSACGYQDFVRENYLSLPIDMPEFRIIYSMYADLLEGFDAKTATPQEIVYELQLLRERLCSQVTYSLAPGKTPPYEDFVSWFLLESKQGFCMHYATTAVLLARMAGIPARYCDGYLVETDDVTKTEENGQFIYTAEILDSNAHAWCEVYIEGLGWIPFEFTYSYFKPPDLSGDMEEETELVTEVIETEFLAESASSTVLREPHSRSTTTIPTEPAATDEVQPTETETHMAWLLLLAAAVCMGAGGMVLARRLALRKREHLFSQKDKQAAAHAAWHWLLALMQYCGVDTEAKTIDGLCEDAESRCARYLNGTDIQEVLVIGTKLCYSPHGITEEELACLIVTAKALAEGIYAASGMTSQLRLKWLKHFI